MAWNNKIVSESTNPLLMFILKTEAGFQIDTKKSLDHSKGGLKYHFRNLLKFYSKISHQKPMAKVESPEQKNSPFAIASILVQMDSIELTRFEVAEYPFEVRFSKLTFLRSTVPVIINAQC